MTGSLSPIPVLPAPTPASVSVSDLVRRYGAVEALRGATFEIAPGEIFGLLGPNGAGKTTAIECILGLRRPDSGSVAIDGINLIENPRHARQTIGAQIQGATLQDKISPRKALEFFASFYRDPASVEGLIGRFGLEAKRNDPFDSLSGGQRQRLFLALAFVNKPRLIVLDEPTEGLDPRSRRELHDLILDMRGSGCTVLMSTHDLGEAQGLCDRVAILDSGRIVAAGSPATLIASARSASRLSFRTAAPLRAADVASLPGVIRCACKDGLWHVGTTAPGDSVAFLIRRLEEDGNRLLDLHVSSPSLEDVFLSLTGRPWDRISGEIE